MDTISNVLSVWELLFRDFATIAAPILRPGRGEFIIIFITRKNGFLGRVKELDSV